MNLKADTQEYAKLVKNIIIVYLMMTVMGVAVIDSGRTPKEHRGINKKNLHGNR